VGHADGPGRKTGLTSLYGTDQTQWRGSDVLRRSRRTRRVKPRFVQWKDLDYWPARRGVRDFAGPVTRLWVHLAEPRYLPDFGVAMHCGFGRQPGRDGTERGGEHARVAPVGGVSRMTAGDLLAALLDAGTYRSWDTAPVDVRPGPGYAGAPIPDGVQTAENLLAHGLVDAVVAPDRLAACLNRVLTALTPVPAASPPAAAAPTGPARPS